MATPVFCCGFECGLASSHGTVGPTLTGTAVFSTTHPRSGARALRTTGVGATGEDGANFTLPTSGRKVMRFYVYFTSSLPDRTCAIGTVAGFSTATAAAGPIFNSSDSKIYAGLDDNTQLILGATGIPVVADTWYCLDVKVDSSNNPWTIDVQVNGAACGQATYAAAGGTSFAVNTRIFPSFGAGGNVTATVDWDDLIVSHTDGDYPLGPGFIWPFIPTADGTHNIAGTGDFQRGNTGTDILNATTTAYQLVDDVPLPSGAVDEADNIRAVAPPNATDYTENVFGPASGARVPTAPPRAVEAVVVVHQITTGTGSFKLNLNDNGTVALIVEAAAASGVTTYRYFTKQFATAPTGGAWTVVAGAGNFNNLRIRFYSADANPDQCFDAGMIEAEFTLLLGWEAEVPHLIFDVLQIVPSGQVPGRMP